MEGSNKKLAMPCDPTSTRRPSVTGPEGEKLATVGDGGVKAQAPPVAAATGPDSSPTAAGTKPETAVDAPAPGPVLNVVRDRRTKKWEKRRLRKREAKAAGRATPGGAVLDGGNRCGSERPKSTTTAPNNLNIGNKNRNDFKARMKRGEELLDAFYRQRREGVVQMPDMSTLAPAIEACMSRFEPVGVAAVGGAGREHDSVATPPSTTVCPSTRERGSCGGGEVCDSLTAVPITESGHQLPRTPAREPGSNPELRPACSMKLTANAEKTLNPVSSVAVAPAQLPNAQSPNRPRPVAGPKGKGIGKGNRANKGVDVSAAESMAAEDTHSNMGEGEDSTRGAKRQRSSDLVSPSSRAADKKVCLEGETRAVGVTLAQASSEPEVPGGSYADMAKKLPHIVVVDKSGLQMDEHQATILRKTIDKVAYQLFRTNRGKPSTEWWMPLWMQTAKPHRGGLKVFPQDEPTYRWVSTAVERLPGLWGGSGGYKVVKESELPRYRTAVLYVPDFEEDREEIPGWTVTLREYLAEMNRAIDFRKWPVFKHDLRIRGDTINHILVMGAPIDQIEHLRRIGFRLNYMGGRIYVRIRGVNYRLGRAGHAGTSSVQAVESCSATVAMETEACVADAGSALPDKEIEKGDLTEEEVERLLGMDDASEDITGDIESLNIASPAPSIGEGMATSPSVKS